MSTGIKSGLLLTSVDSEHTAWLVMHSSYTISKSLSKSHSYSTISYLLHSVSNHVCLHNLQPSYSKRSCSSYFSQEPLLTTAQQCSKVQITTSYCATRRQSRVFWFDQSEGASFPWVRPEGGEEEMGQGREKPGKAMPPNNACHSSGRFDQLAPLAWSMTMWWCMLVDSTSSSDVGVLHLPAPTQNNINVILRRSQFPSQSPAWELQKFKYLLYIRG